MSWYVFEVRHLGSGFEVLAAELAGLEAPVYRTRAREAGSVSAQLQLPALPSAPADATATAKREAWVRRVLAAARAVEAEQGPWWGCQDVADKLGRPLRRVAPAMMALLRRGSLMRSEVGEDARGRTVFAWTSSLSPREMLSMADR